jgi:hypothetical protein
MKHLITWIITDIINSRRGILNDKLVFWDSSKDESKNRKEVYWGEKMYLVVDENEPILEEYARLLFGIGLMERGRIYWQFFTIAGELEWWKRGKI